MYRPITAACAALALAACATPTVYAPANPNAASSVGFSEYRIENNRYRVTFQGGPGATGRSFSHFPTIIDSIRDRLLTLLRERGGPGSPR